MSYRDEQVAEYVRIPYIKTGYRKGGSVMDLFRWHNETMNMWSLLVIPVISIFIYSMYGWGEPVLFLLPLHGILHVPFSVGNHLFRELDFVTHTRWRMLDLLATHVSSFILCVAFGYYFYSRFVYSVVLCLEFIICSYLVWLERVHYGCVKRGEEVEWNRGMKTLLVGIEVFVYLLPLLYRGYTVVPLSLIVGGITYGMGIPERYYPYRFDYVFNGNHIMHIMLLVAHVGEYSYMLDIIQQR